MRKEEKRLFIRNLVSRKGGKEKKGKEGKKSVALTFVKSVNIPVCLSIYRAPECVGSSASGVCACVRVCMYVRACVRVKQTTQGQV